jgi:hypothetical protein
MEPTDEPPASPPRMSAGPLLPPRRDTKASSFIEEEPPALPPRIIQQLPTPNTTTMPTDRNQQRAMVADLVPDLHGITPSKGLSTELDSHDTVLTRQSITAAEQKSIPATVNMPCTFNITPTNLIPDWYRTGWTSLSAKSNPGGTLNIQSTRSHNDFLDEVLPTFLYGEWYHNGAALFLTAIVSWFLAKMNAGIGSILLFCLFIGRK